MARPRRSGCFPDSWNSPPTDEALNLVHVCDRELSSQSRRQAQPRIHHCEDSRLPASFFTQVEPYHRSLMWTSVLIVSYLRVKRVGSSFSLHSTCSQVTNVDSCPHCFISTSKDSRLQLLSSLNPHTGNYLLFFIPNTSGYCVTPNAIWPKRYYSTDTG